MSNAEGIFKDLIDKESLKELINEVGKEDLYIDFKRVPNASEGKFCDSCRKNLGKGLSGFANSAGGVLVFGVKEEGDDLLLDPINEVRSFDQKIQENINRLTSYNVPEVISKIITEGENSGYVAVLIPKSDLAPHQLIQDKKYYRRSGESFKPMEHYELENMFGRAPKPVLVPDIIIERNGGSSTHHDYKLIFGIRNNGRLAGTYPFLGINLNNGYSIDSYELDGNRNPGLPKLRNSNTGGNRFVEYGQAGDTIVFPGHFLKVTCAKIKEDKRTNTFNLGDFSADFKVASKESLLSERTITTSIDEIKEMIASGKSYFELSEDN
ncbi:conserved hypothetical protein [Halobacteriovorax marinus SJ]|uniref:Schlafen AlbA-2 domain-containing protein n=1 Tax=Halobacteriovorax marinus (strain ATCC BAA-682 / DSM 15412 / SJ) TaxID=862908 RepID=E1X5X8_HALMS|nr:RNA-binding domain-containing protein [Halobacteriovorax marinus]CBW25695.1 conserved hypothetical protein [Halobacteriovorax marinus SJ]